MFITGADGVRAANSPRRGEGCVVARGERIAFLFAAEEKGGKRSRQKGDFVSPFWKSP